VDFHLSDPVAVLLILVVAGFMARTDPRLLAYLSKFAATAFAWCGMQRPFMNRVSHKKEKRVG
jgi:hypothetical protein